MSEIRPNAADSQSAATAPVWFGAVFVVIGLGIMAGMVAWPEGLNVPMWVGLAAAATFSVAGASVIAQSLGYARVGRWIAVAVVFLLAVPGLWIMLGSDEMSCTRSVSFLWSSSGEAGDLECRVVFGVGAIGTIAAGLAVAWAAWRGAGRRPEPQAVSESDRSAHSP
jgi:hypothetical protein